ncbi:MAG: hypothetical protein FWG81_00610 [Betaproteobacteria bacterium]|nr:hypothetical protein [Betaproteobacteria bacterium]
METGIDSKTKRRSNSWYDSALVTQTGENILADIDAKGIDILRRYKLVWSGWSSERELKSNDQVLVDGKPHHRLIDIHEAHALQLFFLSIVWRAAASSRPEFKDFILNHNELEDLRLKILNKNPGNFSEYPIQLFQLSTLGIHHNRTPLIEQKEMLDVNLYANNTVDYARVYFDGLTAHIHLLRGRNVSQSYQQTCLGAQGTTTVFLHRFEDSRANADIKEMIETVLKEQYIPPSSPSLISMAIKLAWNIR